MEEKNKTLTVAVIALLTSLGFGGSTLLDNPSALDDYYICDSSFETGEFARLSRSKFTAYPNEFDNKGYERCIEDGEKGKWRPLVSYAKDNNIDINTLIPSDEENEEIIYDEIKLGVKYECSQHECVKIGD